MHTMALRYTHFYISLSSSFCKEMLKRDEEVADPVDLHLKYNCPIVAESLVFQGALAIE